VTGWSGRGEAGCGGDPLAGGVAGADTQLGHAGVLFVQQQLSGQLGGPGGVAAAAAVRAIL